jgi:hypothetical protein
VIHLLYCSIFSIIHYIEIFIKGTKFFFCQNSCILLIAVNRFSAWAQCRRPSTRCGQKNTYECLLRVYQLV